MLPATIREKSTQIVAHCAPNRRRFSATPLVLMKAELTHDLLERARRGDAEAMGQLLERYQPYLYLLAQRRLSPRIRTRVDPSDIVQQTLFEMQRDLPAFRGGAEEELLAWLRRILQHNV